MVLCTSRENNSSFVLCEIYIDEGDDFMTSTTRKNSKKAKGLTYKGKPLVRKGNMLYYGNSDDKFIITMKIQDNMTVKDLNVAASVSIELQHNDFTLKPKERIIKKAEREGLYRALDIGTIWLEDALESE